MHQRNHAVWRHCACGMAAGRFRPRYTRPTLKSVTIGIFCSVKRLIRGCKERFRRNGGLRCVGDSDTRCHRERFTVHPESKPHLLDDFPGDPLRIVFLMEPGKKHNKLIAPETRDGIRSAHACFQAVCEMLKGSVPCCMAMSIIDGLN
jgi:hypothetical protein